MVSYDADTSGHEAINNLSSYAFGKAFLITGASKSGLGAEIALTLAAAKPKQLLLAGRTKEKITPVIEEIQKADSSINVVFIELDLLDNSSVKRAVENIKGVTKEIHGLVNNAGVMAPRDYLVSKHGIESQFAVNHVGHFLLTNLLIQEGLVGGQGTTIVNVSSLGYQLAEANLEDPNFQDGKTYNGWRAYGQSKTANILFSHALGKKLGKHDVAVFAVHPGLMMESLLLVNSGNTEEYLMEGFKLAIERNDGNPLHPPTTKTLQQGAACVVIALLDPSFRALSPAFLVENQVAEAKSYATDAAKAEQLWALSENLVGQKFDL